MDVPKEKSADSEMGDAKSKTTRCGAEKRRARRARLNARAPQGGTAKQMGTPGPSAISSGSGPARAPLGHKQARTAQDPGAPKGATGETQAGHSGGGRAQGKRKRVPGQTPPSARQSQKKARPPLPTLGADPALNICVFLEGFPERLLTNAQQLVIQERVAEVLDRMMEGPDSDGFIPRFQNHIFRQGALFVTCLDVQSRDWLSQVIRELQLEGMSLRVTPAADIPKPRRAMVHIQGPEMTPEVIVARLDRQNPGLGAKKWVILGSERVGLSTTRLVVGLWEPAIRALEGLGFKPWFLLSRATVKLLGKQEPRGEEGGPAQSQQPVTG